MKFVEWSVLACMPRGIHLPDENSRKARIFVLPIHSKRFHQPPLLFGLTRPDMLPQIYTFTTNVSSKHHSSQISLTSEVHVLYDGLRHHGSYLRWFKTT